MTRPLMALFARQFGDMKHERRTPQKASLNIWALVFGALLFMILPALLAFAGV